MLTQEQLAPYSELVHRLLNTELIFLSRRLQPDTCPDSAEIPPAAAKYFEEVAYGGLLFECETGVPCEVGTVTGVCFSALTLWDSAGFVLIGPYRPVQPQEEREAAARAARDAGAEFEQYYTGLPVIGRDKLRAVFSVLASGLCGHALAADAFCSRELSPENPSPCPVFEEDSLQMRANAVAQRYQNERRFLEAVAAGDLSALNYAENTGARLHRIPNELRNRKNMFIVLNTLLRKAVETAQVHPYYIDEISARWSIRAEAACTEQELDEMCRVMVAEYCRLAKTHSMTGYSPNVRGMLTYVQFNLSENISLEAIAAQLGVNASYLSSQFNREVGKSLPEYVSEKRIAEAKRMLSGRGRLPIGQIAAAIGFSDVNYFTKVFKKKTGKTPSAYRAECRQAEREK